MMGWRAFLLLVAIGVAGAASTLLVGLAMGMHADELTRLGVLLLPALAVTVLAATIARPVLLRAPIRQRVVATAMLASVLSFANLTALASLMFVSREDATLVGVLVLYSVGAGIGVALIQARSALSAVDRLAKTARMLAEGDLGVRAGRLGDGPELDALARTLDAMAERLSRSLAQVRDSEARRRDLITAVSHDLRTPLADLRAMIEAIDDAVVEDPPSLRRYATEMRRAVGSLVVLVDDLFELAQLDVAGVQLESRRVPLQDVVRSALAACSTQATMKGLAVETSIENAVEAACSPRLARVLQNLVQNAVRHTPADGTVLVVARRDRAELEIAVEDTGEGIAPEDLVRVFEPFWRGDPARSGAGSGLGLALAKRIVDALGGTIRAESQPSRGSRFAVRLPYSSVPAARAPIPD
ncbi:MAG: HAMP domain-containing histidine kinase [Chloroflexi bacterium]|nr:MAG: HAMP domain-containing histidine kinase [Chloroflexota bacterium]